MIPMTSTEHSHHIENTIDADSNPVAICSCGSASDDDFNENDGPKNQFKVDAWSESHLTEMARSTGW